MKIIKNIACTLVTGFLGSGKSSFINQLIEHKQSAEDWGLLINEFGQIGIDSHLINSDKQGQSIAIKEVNGGCICCTSQLPLQIALSRLIAEHRPTRLIIEPTGLAHPKSLLEQLSEPHWQSSVSMQSVICILNARQWSDERYRSHEGYQSHVKYADVIVINRYVEITQRQQLIDWITILNPFATIYWQLAETKSQACDEQIKQYLKHLDDKSQVIEQHRNNHTQRVKVSLQPLLQSPISYQNLTAQPDDQEPHKSVALPYRYHDSQQLDGILSVQIGGWRLPKDWIFAYNQLERWLFELDDWQRIKGVLQTDNGWLRINYTTDSLSTASCSPQIDNRIEIIFMNHQTPLDECQWEQADSQLLDCLITSES